MEESQLAKNGRMYLERRPTILLGMSPGNPFFYVNQNLEKQFEFARSKTHHKIMVIIFDKISEHNYRAVSSKNPERSARVKANRLRNKCQDALRSCRITNELVEYVNWSRDVETSASYKDTLMYVKKLYEATCHFKKDVQESTHLALMSLNKSRVKNKAENSEESVIDLEEGVNYLLKELAFFSVVADIYGKSKEFVLVYHRPWPLLENYFDGKYDDILRSSLGFYVLK